MYIDALIPETRQGGGRFQIPLSAKSIAHHEQIKAHSSS
jgi:hypothetical protein